VSVGSLLAARGPSGLDLDLLGGSTGLDRRITLPYIQKTGLGLDAASTELLGVRVPMVTMPVGPGRNVAMLVEVAARNQILRTRGRHAARVLADQLERRLEHTAGGPFEDEPYSEAADL